MKYQGSPLWLIDYESSISSEDNEFWDKFDGEDATADYDEMVYLALKGYQR